MRSPLGTRSSQSRRFVVRTARGYAIDFTVDLGQRNADIRRGRMTPHHRLVSWGGAVTAVPTSSVDLLHTLNAIPLTVKPHIVTFEDYLPRTPPDTSEDAMQRSLRRLLHRPNCVRLLALSEYAVRQFRWQNRGYDRLEALASKMEVAPPGLSLRAERGKPLGPTLKLLFVGRDFMRKGLPAVLEAHRALLASGVPVETNVVSGLEWTADDYIGPSDALQVDATRRALAQSGIIVHGAVDNDRVLALMREASFLVLPTLHDTFGYVALEAMAAATPVIATRTCALPEVVEHGYSGFLLDLESDPHVGKWVGTYLRNDPGYGELYAETVGAVGLQLTELLLDFWEAGRGGYETMSSAALSVAASRFSRDGARWRLEELYAECMGTPPPEREVC